MHADQVEAGSVHSNVYGMHRAEPGNETRMKQHTIIISLQQNYDQCNESKEQ